MKETGEGHMTESEMWKGQRLFTFPGRHKFPFPRQGFSVQPGCLGSPCVDQAGTHRLCLSLPPSAASPPPPGAVLGGTTG